MDLRSLYAGSPRSLSRGARTKTDQRQRLRAIPDTFYPESMTCSVSTLSSHSPSPAPSLDGSASPVFDTADYSDPSFVSTNIMSTGQAAFGPQYQQSPEELFAVKAGQPQMPTERPQSLGLPLRMRDDACAQADTKKNLKRATTHPVRSSLVGVRRASHQAFDLMAPPPGRRKYSLAKTDLPRDSYPHSVDADPSAALTSRITASILREGYGVRGPKTTVPPKVHDAVQRCLQEVSTTVQKDHAPWALPQYRPRHSKAYRTDSDMQSRASDQLSDHDAAGSRTRYGASSGDEEDPFAYDNSNASMYKNLYGFGKGGRGMRARLSDASRPYSCPFRKRNPIMFNVRDHEHCAKRPFFGIQDLKHHIRTHHRSCGPAHSCPRCKASFQNQSDLSEHLMVPADQMCEPNGCVSDIVVEDGITEEMDRALADRTPRHLVNSWEQIWKLLFPQDASPQDSEYVPVIEMVEMEQKMDDSQAELRADLSESLRKLLPDQSQEVCFFLAGQFQLVVEQHRAKVNRKCRISASGESPPPSASEKSRTTSVRLSRFSMRNSEVNALRASNIHGRSASLLSSPKSHGRRPSQAYQQVHPRTTVSPASTTSSVYSQDAAPAPSTKSRPATRSSTFSMSGMQVESPRLPFKDWVQGVKFNGTTTTTTSDNNNDDEKKYQRDSGLALEQCETCQMEPCQCEGYNGYADQLSAFMTPAPGTNQPPGTAPYSAANQVGDYEELDWAAQYGGQSATPGVPGADPRMQMKGSRMGLNAQGSETSGLKAAAVQAQQGFI
ncbi:hypothetical protein KVR01_000370 [Diaporthe batatas]|uniref:uncharacterized protein n=1 Tax=Diaporthe batatas TaxID=748121 RepID=UPI001D059C94|nr:uncharacterized protein KVR01_000370 [Diaporthe batatas]KAG8169625.1 hypothetical protein KVR01_000370 [Diaporthe batatas]